MSWLRVKTLLLALGFLGMVLPYAHAQKPTVQPLGVKDRWMKVTYDHFIQTTKNELLIFTPYARGVNAIKPLADLRIARGKNLTMTALVEGPAAIKNKTHVAFERILITTYGVPLNKSGEKPFFVASTYLIRDREAVLVIGQPLDLGLEGFNPNTTILIEDPIAVKAFVKSFTEALTFAEQFPISKTGSDRLITEGQTMQERAQP